MNEPPMSSETKQTASITASVDIAIPATPNFLQTTDGKSIPVGSVSKSDLRKIAKAWSAALIARGA